MINHRLRGRTTTATLVALATAATLLAACSSDSDDEADGDGPVSITVEGWRPGDEQGTIDAVNKQADAFMADHPDIKVEPVEWEWTAETFSTQLAGDQLPTTFRVPFTDAKGLAERQQIADVTDYVEALPYAADFNPSVLEAAKDADGRIYGLPTDVYGIGLHYNRQLFEEAGLDPDVPPTNWEEIRAAADAIADKKVHAEASSQLATLEEAARQAQAIHAGSRAALVTLLERAGVSDRATLHVLDASWSRREQLRQQLQQLDHELVRVTRLPIEEHLELLGERTEPQLRALLDTTRDCVDGIAGEHAVAKEARNAVQKQIGALEEGDTRAGAVIRIRDARARLDQLVPEYRQLALQERMLQTMLDDHARRDMGPVVERTSRYLAQLTCGAWTRMVIGVGDDDRPQVQLQRAATDDDIGELVTLDGLSMGTIDQLYFALRLATLVEGSGRGESMPLVLDDVLPSFDDERAAATFQLLAEVSEHFQVVVLTHHAHLAHLAEQVIDPGCVQLHPILRFGVENVAGAKAGS